jgi:hypothetical protein
MSETRCSCDRFEKLEGATVPAYVSAFLKPSDQSQNADRYRCLWCNCEWEKHSEENSTRPSLVRLRTAQKSQDK